MIPTSDIKVIPHSDAVQVSLIIWGRDARREDGIPLLRCWTRLPPSAVIAPQFQPRPSSFAQSLRAKQAVRCQPLRKGITHYTLQAKSCAKGTLSPLDSLPRNRWFLWILPAKKGCRPPLESTQKAKTECAKMQAHSILLF